MLIGEHARQCEAGGVKGRTEIDGENRIPLGDGELLERRHMLDAGIVDEHVEPAEAVKRHVDHAGDRVGLRHVGTRIGDRNAKIGVDRLLRRFDLLGLAEAVEHDSCACRRERAGDAETDAAGRAGHQRHLSFEGLSGRSLRLCHSFQPPAR
jgi:hypothetical protein